MVRTKTLLRLAVLLPLAVSAWGCAGAGARLYNAMTPTPSLPPHRVAFSDSALAWSLKPGTGAIQGQAFLSTRGGDVKVGAGREVQLLPASPYTQEMFTVTGLEDHDMQLADSRLERYERRTVADGSGHFRFIGLPSGRYYLLTNIVWEIPRRTAFGDYATQLTGGYAAGTVVLAPGQSADVTVTR